MRIALAIWEGRISPVFDVSRRMLILDVEEGVIIGKSRETLANDNPVIKAAKLAEIGVGTLICGAISRHVQDILATYGIRTIPFIAGNIEQVEAAYLEGNLTDASFKMPGCTVAKERIDKR